MPRIFAVIIAGLLLTNCLVHSPNMEGKQPYLRILSYNIKHGQGMDGKIDLKRIAKVIAREHPDLVALQEVDKGCDRSGKQDIAAELARLLGMQHRFGKFMDYQGGEYGMAILCRLPITKTIRHPLPEGAEPRCALEVQVQVSGLPALLSFICIHNDWTNQAFRVKQIEALLEFLRKRDNPIILAGDFNGQRTDKSMKLLKEADWQILEKDSKDGKKTFPSTEPKVEIDFFVMSNFPRFSFIHHVINEQIASDHRPIYAVFFWRQTKREHRGMIEISASKRE